MHVLMPNRGSTQRFKTSHNAMIARKIPNCLRSIVLDFLVQRAAAAI
jgi:hypothetical protein